MGDQRTPLRQHGMIATSPGWRRHFWSWQDTEAPALVQSRDADELWPVVLAFWTTAVTNIPAFWTIRTGNRR